MSTLFEPKTKVSLKSPCSGYNTTEIFTVISYDPQFGGKFLIVLDSNFKKFTLKPELLREVTTFENFYNEFYF